MTQPKHFLFSTKLNTFAQPNTRICIHPAWLTDTSQARITQPINQALGEFACLSAMQSRVADLFRPLCDLFIPSVVLFFVSLEHARGSFWLTASSRPSLRRSSFC